MTPRLDARRMARTQALADFDRAFAEFGTSLAGMDEAGRGPLLGPVVAACVVMPAAPLLPGVDDSKRLPPARREALYQAIRDTALYVGVGEASAGEIDRINILEATKLAMRRAAGAAPATLCLVDAVGGLALPFATRAVIHGDALSYSIAAASIIAKVTRDRQITALAAAYPGYGLERNMGYGTAEHIAALVRLGPCPAHRRTFITKWNAEKEAEER